MIAPVVEELAKEYDGKLRVGKVDVDSNQQMAMQFGVRSIPTLLIFKNGRVVDQIVGAVPKRMLAEKVLKHLN
jgi:thioredoxin 1